MGYLRVYKAEWVCIKSKKWKRAMLLADDSRDVKFVLERAGECIDKDPWNKDKESLRVEDMGKIISIETIDTPSIGK